MDPSTLKQQAPATVEEQLYDDRHDPIKTDDGPETFVPEDIFQPLPPLEGVPEEPNPLTIRGVVIGIILGSVVNCSNIYLGLKTGFNFGTSMFASIFGFAIAKLLTTTLEGVPILGIPFGPQENSIIQASAAGAGGLTGLFVAALPAMYQLDLLSEKVSDDFGRIMTLSLIGCFFGLCFGVPLRKFFIIQVARELRLTFPSSTAAAYTIRSMHAAGTGATESLKKIKALGYSFGFAMALRVVSSYALGILWDWHIFTWIFIAGGYNNYAIHIESWDWFVELTPAFIGSGFLVGLNVAVSYFIGSFTVSGFLGPILVYTGVCAGKQRAPDDERWSQYVSYNSMSGISEPGYVPSPRYWFLYPGVMVLLCCSMAEFLVHYKILVYGAQYAWASWCRSINRLLVSRGRHISFFERSSTERESPSGVAEDFATPDQQVPGWVWSSGSLIMVAVAVIIFEVQFDINGGLAIIAMLLTVIFSFMAIYGCGITDVSTVTASAKSSQLVFGGVTQGMEVNQALSTNLIAGAITTSGADMATTLVSDFRVGFLLRTPPDKQFYAQAIGTFFAVFLGPAMFLLFTSAYPCINNPDDYDTCPFTVPSVTAWKALAQAVTMRNIPIPLSSGIFSIVLGVVSILQVLLKRKFLAGDREKYRQWLPNWMAIGIAFIIPATHFSTAMCTGAIIAHFWAKKYPISHSTYCYAIAAGLIAGEGLGGVVNAILALANVDGERYGTTVGCPLNSC